MFLEDVNNSGNSEYFVLSFSCCRDSITMWAEFGNANGYNIGFDSRKIIKRIDEANEVEYHGLVIYDRDKQIKYIHEFMEQFIKEFPQFTDMVDKGYNDRNDEEYRKMCISFSDKISIYSMFF